MPSPERTCTIEFVHGGVIHVVGSQQDIQTRIAHAKAAEKANDPRVGPVAGWITVERVHGFAGRGSANAWPEVTVNPDSVSAIYALDTHSERPR